MRLKEELKRKSKSGQKTSFSMGELSSEEKKLIEKIRSTTKSLNLNNVTRTKAYLDFYRCHREIHWAFLGHMVSRNGGWNMTDLQGDLLANLLTEREQKSFFSFLERGNWLIFQDVFPQFLLYEESIKRNKSFFHLLPLFNVSIFMETIWNHFLRYQDCYLLAIALIINEQSYLEKRVIQNPVYKKNVFDTPEFKVQELFAFTYILLPYQEGKLKMKGQILHHFDNLSERIKLGKRLYSLLFQNETMLKGYLDWANSQPHTGSRKDYWPQLFHHLKEGIPSNGYHLRLSACQLKPNAERLYSPELSNSWKNVKHQPAEIGDWFSDWRIIYFLIDADEYIDGEIINGYCKSLERLELAIKAKKTLAIFE